MQQRRGTAAQWTAANPILAAGEIGFETDTSKFKMGNGSSAWSALQYFANAAELAAIVDGAPGLLDTLNELAAAMGDNPNFLSLYATNAKVDESIILGAQSIQTASNSLSAALTNHNNYTQEVHGIADTTALATKTYSDTALTTHNSSAIDVHGIPDTTALATKIYADSAVTTAVAALTKASVGLSVVDNVEDANKPVSTAQALAISTAKTEAITAAGSAADSKISTHDLDTENVHGITNTALLVTQTDLSNALSGAVVDQSSLAGVGITWNIDVEAFDVDETYITNATETELDLKAPLASPTFTGTVSGVTKTHVGLGSVDNTADTAKPVSTAQATAIATAKSEAIADATAQVEALLTGAPAALNTLDELAAALGDDANFASTITTSLGLKAPLASPTFTGTVTVAAAGVAFTDGTQTKAGVPSITNIPTAIAAGAHTLAAGRADQFIPLTGAVVITLPATGYSTGQSIDFYQESGTGASFSSDSIDEEQQVSYMDSVVGTPGRNFRTTNSVATAMKISSGWLVFGDLSA